MAGSIDTNRDYLGTVISVMDPNRAGRCKVRVPTIMDGMSDAHLPWANPGSVSTFGGEGGGCLSVPKKGTTVKVRFNSGDIMAPEYYSVQKVDKNLINEIKDDYEDAQVLLYDHTHNLSVMYTVNSGIRIYLGDSFIQITPDGNITLQHNGQTTILQLTDNKILMTSNDEIDISSTNSINVDAKTVNITSSERTNITGNFGGECAVNGNALTEALLFLAKAIDAKYPATPMTCESQIMNLSKRIKNSKISYTA